MKVPTNTCLPCGGPAKFNCSTVANHTIYVGGMNTLMLGPGGQLWRIETTNGMTDKLHSTDPKNVPASYEFCTLNITMVLKKLLDFWCVIQIQLGVELLCSALHTLHSMQKFLIILLNQLHWKLVVSAEFKLWV